MKLSRSLALGILAALAVPGTAAAHPGVYTTAQRTLPAGAPCRMPDASCLQTNSQYAVGNDGWAMSFTEANGAPAGRGLVNYKFLPGTWRGTDKPSWLAYPDAQTNLQAHATCLGAPWDTPANILAYQNDPFYNYIPWQKTSAGLGDDPAKWLALVKTLTGVDLAALSGEAELSSACAGAGGTYYKADTAAKITSALESSISTPLQSQITKLQGEKAAVETALAAARVVPARPLTLTLSAKRFDQGVAMVTGQPGTAVTVRALLSSATARKLRLARAIATETATIDAQGAALVSLDLTAKARKAVDRHRPALKVTVDVAGGGVRKTATGTLTR